MSHDSSLEPILRAVEPAVRLIPERYLRQVLNYLIDRGRSFPTSPELPCWVSREDLVSAEVLPPHVLSETEPSLLLVTDPHDRQISHLPQPEQLRAYWRVLFQAAVMREIDQKTASGRLTVARAHEKLARLGPAVAREIGYVLRSEHLVDPEGDALAQYRAFAATYLDLANFERPLVEEFFPSLAGGDLVDRLLAEELDVVGLLAKTRPAGAADPYREPPPDERWTASDTHVVVPATVSSEVGGLLSRAQEAEHKGNNVRAAILHEQLAATASGEASARATSSAMAALAKLVDSLGDTLGWEPDLRQEWRQALAPLLEPAATGVWPRAARCLYELQTIPADLSREVYAVDLAETIRTLGKRPLKRHLPRARPVLMLMHLKKAHAQMLRAGLGHSAELRLDRLFHHQIHALERDVRRDFTPVIVEALARAGLVPANTVEVVARDKLVAELLDRVCDRGYLRLGDLRDAVARNRLKMPDLAGPGELLRGDALLRADLELAYALDGVYRKGEFYLRWIQRFSALFFGTKYGRLITLFLAIPFGGAFLSLMAVEEFREIGEGIVSKFHRPTSKSTQPRPAPATASDSAKQPTPAPDVIQADQVEYHEETNEVEWYPPDVVTSDEVTVDESGELSWKDSEPVAVVVKALDKAPITVVVDAFRPFDPTNVPTKKEEQTGWFKLTEQSFAALQREQVPDAVLAKLEPMKDKMLSRTTLIGKIAKFLGPEEAKQYQGLILRHAEHGSYIVTVPSIIGLGIFLLLMFHVPPFRRAVLVGLDYVWWAVRGILWDVPMSVWRSPAVRDFRQSLAVRFLMRHFWSPLLIVTLLFGAMLLVGVSPWFLLRWGWAFWAVLTLAYNTIGWVIQDRIAEAISDGWRVIRTNLIPGLFMLIVDLFRMLGNWIERKLYAVDEWFRYRSGDSQGSLALKAFLGLLWFPIAYVFRFAFYLLLEPQINPLKHFPVVTVSHKLMLPLVVPNAKTEPSIFGAIVAQQTGLGVTQANSLAFGLVACIPGIFGFIAWEFAANWRLYAKNRSARLRPVMLGSHGESMRGLLRPGFHSGTIPKMYRKLRHAKGAKASRLHHDSAHAAEGISRFAEREFIDLLRHCPTWGGLALSVEAVRFGCQRVAIEFAAPSLGRDVFTVAFENLEGTIEATIEQVGWADKLTDPQRAAFIAALRGFLDMSAAERIDGRERVEATPPAPGFADLARPESWTEWVDQWKPERGAGNAERGTEKAKNEANAERKK